MGLEKSGLVARSGSSSAWHRRTNSRIGIEQRDYHRVLIAARIRGDQRIQRARAGLAIRKLRRADLAWISTLFAHAPAAISEV